MSVISAFALLDLAIYTADCIDIIPCFLREVSWCLQHWGISFCQEPFPRKSTSISVSLVLPAELIFFLTSLFFSFYFQVAASNTAELFIFLLSYLIIWVLQAGHFELNWVGRHTAKEVRMSWFPCIHMLLWTNGQIILSSKFHYCSFSLLLPTVMWRWTILPSSLLDLKMPLG